MGADAVSNQSNPSLAISRVLEDIDLVGTPYCMVADLTAVFSSPFDVMQKRGSFDGFDINSFLTCEKFGRVVDSLDMGSAVRWTDVVEISDRIRLMASMGFAMFLPSINTWQCDGMGSVLECEISIDVAVLHGDESRNLPVCSGFLREISSRG